MLPGMFRRASRPTQTAARKFVHLSIEELETRTVPTFVTVTNTSGDAATPGSLPYLIAQSNAHGGYTILFSTPLNTLFNSPQTINLDSQLNVTAPLTIWGPGADLLTITPAAGNNRVFNIGATSPTTISGVTLSNTTGGTAAAIFDYNSDLTILQSVITGFNNTNSNGYQGGAIELSQPATLAIYYSTISGNATTGNGGGIAVTNGGTENIYESTITGNTATGIQAGGGLYFWGNNTATIKNSTIVGNSAPNSTNGGGIAEVNFSGRTLTLSSTIVAQNTDKNNAAPDINQVGGSTLAADFSLIGSTTGTTAITGANNQTNVSPGFTTFTPSDNGGPTPTLALPAGSPALAGGTANGFTNDQRGPGFLRTVNGNTDIGSFQTQPISPVVTSISPSSGPSSGSTAVTITGSNFTGATAVLFGSTPALQFTVNSATSITAVSPAGSGTVDVSVITPSGSSATNSADLFTFTIAPPSPTPPSLTVPVPLHLAVFLSNQELDNQLNLALSWQTLLAGSAMEADLMQANAIASLLDSALVADEMHLAYDLALFVNAPANFSVSSPLTWMLAVDVAATSSAIAGDPLFQTPDGFLESTQLLALGLHAFITPSSTSQAAITALQQTPTLETLLAPLLPRLSSLTAG